MKQNCIISFKIVLLPLFTNLLPFDFRLVTTDHIIHVYRFNIVKVPEVLFDF